MSHGIPRVDDRRILSGIIYVIKHGLQWKDASREYGPHKTQPKTSKNDLSAAIHETAEMLHEHGLIDKVTMKEFDESCLVPSEEITPEEIKAILEHEHLSQPVFAGI